MEWVEIFRFFECYNTKLGIETKEDFEKAINIENQTNIWFKISNKV